MAVVQERPGKVEEMQPEVDEATDSGFAVDQDMRFWQVPASGAGDDHGQRRIRTQPVVLVLPGKAEGATGGIA